MRPQWTDLPEGATTEVGSLTLLKAESVNKRLMSGITACLRTENYAALFIKAAFVVSPTCRHARGMGDRNDARCQ